MPSGTTIFKVRFTDHLNLSASNLARIAETTEEHAKRGVVFKFVFKSENPGDLADPSNCFFSRDPEYVARAQACAWHLGGGFYFQNGQIYLKIKCRRAFDLDSAYEFYRSHGKSTKAFPQNRIDEYSKTYPSVKSLNPLIITPSYQYGTIKGNAENEFYRALLANDWVAKDILIHCLPGVEIECPFYVLFNRFVVKVGGAGEDNQTSDLFYDVAIDKITRSQGHIEIPKISGKYFFLKRSDLLQAGRFQRFQDIRQELVFIQPDETCLFVTHNWQRPDQPDPYNRQYKELVRLLKGDELSFRSQQMQYNIGTRTFLSYGPLQTESISPNTFQHIWYDFSCMPQKPREHDDELLFREQLTNLSNIFASKIRTVQIGGKTKQKRRAWCVMEQEIAKKNNGINMVFEGELPYFGLGIDNNDQVFGRVRSSLKGTRATDFDDIRIIEWILYKSITELLAERKKRHKEESQLGEDKVELRQDRDGGPA